DCTGFKGMLIEEALHTGYEDWSHWLPCDSAIAVQTQAIADPLPYTRSTAHDFGWQWRIPLQNRVGNGMVFCSRYVSDEQAEETLLANLDGAPINAPRVIKFKTGRRRKGWNKNCVALGLASGFVEPLESTSIHLIMTGIVRLMRLFPFDGVRQSAIDEYNEKLTSELHSIRDFIILHYKVTQRDDTPFWRHCHSMDVPESLSHKIRLFKDTGRVFLDDGDIFRVDSWTQVMLGQGLEPKQYHRIVNEMSDDELQRFLAGMRSAIEQRVNSLPSHQQFIRRYCLAS
ncbi:MAG: tryptophan halogenase family protein, partial [Paraglaciecola polaris]